MGTASIGSVQGGHLCRPLARPSGPTLSAAFRKKAAAEMQQWAAHDRQALLSEESRPRFEKARKRPELFKDHEQLRGALLDFIADFANWDNSTVQEYLDTSRALTQAAHEALGGAPGTRPLVVDPFAGGGSIPLEALRVGADAFASDLNPVPVLLNKVLLEYIPKYGQRFADEVRKWGEWIKGEAEKELAEFYPKDSDGATPIAYLWARTIQCEGPGCGAVVPLVSPYGSEKSRTTLGRCAWFRTKDNGESTLKWCKVRSPMKSGKERSSAAPLHVPAADTQHPPQAFASSSRRVTAAHRLLCSSVL